MLRDRFVSPAVQMLLKRMDTHPEEFVNKESFFENTKWQNLLNEGRFNATEKFFIKRKYMKLKRESTQHKIITMILHGEDSQDNYLAMSTIARVTKKLEREAANKK